MRVELEWVDDVDGGLAELEAYLRQDPRMDDVPIDRGQPTVPSGSLGVAEVLEFIATEISLGLTVHALYDFLQARLRRGSHEKDLRLKLTRTDLPDGTRTVEIDFSGSAEAAVQMVRDALTG